MKKEKRTHNYPKTRKPTGPRPTAGRPPKIEEPTRITVTLERNVFLLFKEKYGLKKMAMRLKGFNGD